jgi:anti-sigma-K factor RskA
VSHDAGSHPVDDLAAYAVHALDEDETRTVEAHLARCSSCRHELDAHRDTLALLTVDAAEPPGVWDRIAEAVATRPRQPPSVSSDAAATDLHAARHRRTKRRRPGPILAAAAAVLALVGGLVIGRLTSDSTEDITDLAEQALQDPDSTIAPLVDPGERPVSRLVVSDGSAFLVLDELPALPAGQAYQLWRIGDGDAVSLGVLGDGTRRSLAISLPPEATEFAITTEPATGVVSATGPLVAQGSFEQASEP